MVKISFKYPKKWQTVLHELLKVFAANSWRPLSVYKAWHDIDKDYLLGCGIKTFSAFDHHFRRLKQWGYLYRLPKPKRKSRYDPAYYKYLFSKAGINKLVQLGYLNHQYEKIAKKTIEKKASVYGITIRRTN